MKILELTNFSAGACGVWTRVKQESEMLAKNGHEVKVFSSNFVKGTNSIAAEKEMLGKIEIRRFPGKKLGGESFMKWGGNRMTQEILSYHPDVIIAHSYRHPHTITASKIAKKIGSKSFLVTHAPFDDSMRSIFAKNFIRFFHDPFTGKSTLKRFDKIITITKWEIPFLQKLGVPKEKIAYIPNGIPQEFFTLRKSREEKKVLFLGRLAPVKDLETLIRASKLLPNVTIELVGPAEEDYLTKLIAMNSSSSVIFSPAIYDIKEKIKKVDSAKVFVLPSIRESMPQSLIEAMAREKIVIASNNAGSRELIQDSKNGFLFEIGNEKQLAEKISLALRGQHRDIRKNARKSVEQFNWKKVIKKLESIL